MAQTEITVQIFESINKVLERLENFGYEWQDTFTGCDHYFSTLSCEQIKTATYKELLDSSIIVRTFHKRKSDTGATMLVHKKKTLDEKGNVIGEVKSSVTVEDSKKVCQLLENAGLVNWMTLNQQNNFYKLGEKVVIAGTVEGLEGSFVEIEEYPSIAHLSEDEKFNELSSFVDSLEMKHGDDYSCKKIYMLYTQSQKEKGR